MQEQAYCHDKAANHQFSIAAAFWMIPIVSTGEHSSLMQNLVQVHSSAHPVILNVMALQYTFSLKGVYHPHWLVQWSCHCSHMCIPAHSPLLPGYINIAQNVLLLTMAGLFLDRFSTWTTEKATTFCKPGREFSQKTQQSCPGQCDSVGWAVILQDKMSLVWFPVRVHDCVVGLVLSQGACERQLIDVSFPLFLPPFPSL